MSALAEDGRRHRRDLLLFLMILAIGGILLLTQRLLAANQGAADLAVVRIDGKETGAYPLHEDREIAIDTDYGHNLLVIKDGTAKMAQADCPDGYCLHERAISRRGDVIVCLPHHLVVEGMTSGEDVPEDDDAVDAVAR